MDNILDKIANYTRMRVGMAQLNSSYEEVKEKALSLPRGDFEFEKALQGDEMHFICECKKASPSKGVISESFPYLEIAKDYEKAGASAISCLTEPKWFLGSLTYLEDIAGSVEIPVLRKDFIVDPYMIYQAKNAGADAVLLIASILSRPEIEQGLRICDDLGISALCEAHGAGEVEMLADAGAKIIGVNNRNLRDFSVDFENSLELFAKAPDDVIFVAESGVKGPADVVKLYESGIRTVLIGELLMRAENRQAKLAELKEAVL